MSAKRWHRYVASFAILLALPTWAAGRGIPGYPDSVLDLDPREVARLPRYCIYTAHFGYATRGNVNLGGTQEEARQWRDRLGDVFQTLHHYCWALMYLHRAKFLAVDPQTRAWNYRAAIAEIDFVLNYVNTHGRYDFVLLPEIMTKRGEALVGLGRGPRALADFERAIELKPDYWPAYAQISDYHKSTGNFTKAREVLELGLSRSPEATGLKRRLEELDEELAKRGSKPKSR